MAGSRLEKIGTVFTRVRDLLRSGVIKESDRPVWYDVYKAFPPKKEPLYVRPVKPLPRTFSKKDEPVPDIFYPEDAIRARFYNVYGTGPKPFDLSKSNFVSTCQRFVEKYLELESRGELDESVLFEETGKVLLAEGVVLRRRGDAKVAPQAKQPGVLELKLSDMFAEQLSVSPVEETTEHTERPQ